MLSGRLLRWMEKLVKYNYRIEYMRGEDNKVADALSRRADHNDGSVPWERVPQVVDPVGAKQTKEEFQLNTICRVSCRDMEAELQAIETRERAHFRRLAVDRRSHLEQARKRQEAIDAATKVVPASQVTPMPVNEKGAIITPTQRCTAFNNKGEQCKCRTAKGQFCYNHMRIEAGLRVKAATIKEMGFGLFAAKHFDKGDHIADYSDQLMLRDDKDGGPYALGLNKREAIDAARTNSGYGRWANDPKGTGKQANAEFVIK